MVDDEAAAGGAAAPELRVLVVEDNPELAGYLELEFEGEVVVPGRTTRVTLAEDLDTARKELSATSFDLVLLDLTLPDSQGLDTILGVIELCPASPIVVITGITDVDFGERALLTGAHDFLIKGRYTSADLRRCVRFAVARQRRALETQSALTSWSDSGTAGGAGVALADRPGGVVSRMASRVPLSESFPQAFDDLVAMYRKLVPLRLEEQGLRVDYRVSSSSRMLAGELGRLRGRAQDLAAIHVCALRQLTTDVTGPRQRALGASADSLLLETLGHLVAYYRDQQIGNAAGLRRPSKPES